MEEADSQFLKNKDRRCASEHSPSKAAPGEALPSLGGSCCFSPAWTPAGLAGKSARTFPKPQRSHNPPSLRVPLYTPSATPLSPCRDAGDTQ